MQPSNLRTAITTAPISTTLIVLNVLVFAAISLDAGLLDVLSLPPSWAGIAAQPWTLLTVYFSSEAAVHIAVTVLTIGLFGARVERLVGPANTLGVYLLAGLAGSFAIVATAAATGFDEPSVGASAAFLGLVGALAAFPRTEWWDKLPLGKVVIMVMVIQFAPVLGIGDWVTSAAHITGLAVGSAYGYLLRSRTDTELPDASSSSR
jgi:membrane associated rhomboid family serine protease